MPLFGGIGHDISAQMTAELATISIFPSEPPADVICDPVGGIFVGFTKYWKRPFFWNPRKIVNPHIIAFGTSGSGKTTFIRTLISRAQVLLDPPPNALIIDAVGEYVKYVEAVGGVVYHIGRKDSINPLDTPAPTLEAKMAQAVTIAKHSGFIDKKAPRQMAIFRRALQRAYERREIKSTEDLKDPRKTPPTLRDLLKVLDEMKEGESSSAETKRTAEAVYERIWGIVSTSPALSQQSTVPLEKLFRLGIVCLDLSPIPTEEGKTSAALLILQYLVSWMRQQGETAPGNIRIFVILDEAHRVFQFKMEDEEHPLAIIFREGRKYGVAAILSSQLIKDFGYDSIANAGTIVMMKVHRADIENVLHGLSLPRYIVEEAANQPTFHGMFLINFKTIQWPAPIPVRVSPYFVKSDITVHVGEPHNSARELLASIARSVT